MIGMIGEWKQTGFAGKGLYEDLHLRVDSHRQRQQVHKATVEGRGTWDEGRTMGGSSAETARRALVYPTSSVVYGILNEHRLLAKRLRRYVFNLKVGSRGRRLRRLEY